MYELSQLAVCLLFVLCTIKDVHIYTLKCIVDSFLCQGRMLFCAFVDCSKAFDSVNRLRLWTKLLQFGITGKLFRVV